jgi:hypothetical protein
MSASSDTLDRKIESLKAKIGESEITLDALIANKDLIQRILGGTENRAYQGGKGGRGLMNISVSDAEAISELNVDFKLNVNFTSAVVEDLRKRSYRDESKVNEQERKLRDLRDELVRAETEKLWVHRSVPVQPPVQAPVQPPVQPSWYVWDGAQALPHDGSMLPVGTLVSQDHGQNWVNAESVGMAVQPPVVQPPADDKSKGGKGK